MAYPTDLPLLEIQNVISIIRNGEVKTKFKDFAHDLWIVQGYAQGMIIGKPEGDFNLLTAQAADDFDPVATLEKLCADDGNAVSAQAAIPWGLILSWALKLLQEIFDEYLGGEGN